MSVMKQRQFLSVVVVALLMVTSGCSFLLPRTDRIAKSDLISFEQAKTAFDRITPNETHTTELAAIGFDLKTNRNIKLLTYLDIIQRFMPNPSITKDDLDPSVRACIEAREKSQAWEVDIGVLTSKRYGDAFLDVTGFVRKTHDTGWDYKVLLLIRDGVVVYKLSSGEPNIDRYDKRIKPLGPLQELDSIVIGAAGRVR